MENNMRIGMKWHKFLIYFSLWFSAVINLLAGGLALSVLVVPSGRYRYDSSLVIGAAVCGLFLIFCGISCIVVRSQLARFKESAPRNLLALQLIAAIAGTVFTMIDTGASLSNAIPSLIVALLTYAYYDKRSELFFN